MQNGKIYFAVKLAKARRGMIKEKEKGGGARLKDEPSDPAEPGKKLIFIYSKITSNSHYVW